MKIYFFAVVLFYFQTSFADSLAYFEALTHKRGPEAMVLHDEIQATSIVLRILNCPITLIERQWGGLFSVKEGIYYLKEYLNISQTHEPDFEKINKSCMATLERYEQQKPSDLFLARALTVEEIEAIKNLSAPDILLKLVLEHVNQDTLCYANRMSFILAAGLGISIGKYSMECYTPLGRRFRLKGPSLGFVTGMGSAVSLPNRSSMSPTLSYRFSLFERSDEDIWNIKNKSKIFASVLGFSAQHDKHKNMSSKKEGMLFDYDFKATMGGGVFFDKSYQLMSKKDLVPLYIKLVQTQLFNKMAEQLVQSSFRIQNISEPITKKVES
jgi:hypothetical protein